MKRVFDYIKNNVGIVISCCLILVLLVLTQVPEWSQTAYISLGAALLAILPGLGLLTAYLAVDFCKKRKKLPAKVIAGVWATLLPLIVYAGVWLYCGGVSCTNCKSISSNIYNEKKWISHVPVCVKCVQYISCENLQHFKQDPPLPQVCLNCQGDVRMRKEEGDELFIQVCVILWMMFYWIVLLIMSLVMLISKYLQKEKSIQ